MSDPQPLVRHVQRARLGAELRRLRLLAGLSGRKLAAHIGIGQASVSRIENAQAVPSLPEVMAWADAVGASEESRAVLVGLTESALNEVEAWRTSQQAGMPALQADVAALEATAQTLRIFQPTIVPGLLQTAEYARQVFTASDVTGRGEYAPAVAARVERQQILYESGRVFEFVLTEPALRWRAGPPSVLRPQLDRVVTVSTLDNVSVGVIPIGTTTPVIPWVGFNLYENRTDDDRSFVTIETPHARVTVSDPEDVRIYQAHMGQLRRVAVWGDDARSLLARMSREVSDDSSASLT
ncbi:MAG: helix-turn-helix domain-containing protein [Streptosporangiaceae bacterium]